MQMNGRAWLQPFFQDFLGSFYGKEWGELPGSGGGQITLTKGGDLEALPTTDEASDGPDR